MSAPNMQHARSLADIESEPPCRLPISNHVELREIHCGIDDQGTKYMVFKILVDGNEAVVGGEVLTKSLPYGAWKHVPGSNSHLLQLTGSAADQRALVESIERSVSRLLGTEAASPVALAA